MSGKPSQSEREKRRTRGSAPSADGPEGFPVVGIGASAGGLEACTKLVKALPAKTGMAFVLVQHLDPDHDSMMADLLAGHTSMAVVQATDGQPLERDRLYVIPPGVYLSVADGALRLSKPEARHGARLPFDFLLNSLAQECGDRAVCVVLSGTGADGSRGIKAVKEKGGLVIAQDPDEAAHDGMPQNAIVTGAVDLVLAAADIPEALVKYDRRTVRPPREDAAPGRGDQKDWLPVIIDMIRAKGGHDFSLYKEGTIRRRIERRRALAEIEVGDMARYVDLLKRDRSELDQLLKDLLINVTSFFRDPKTFELLAETVLPELVKSHPANQPIRIWIAGCSTGEEAYSLAMLFREEITAAKRNIKLQVFASDVDADAVLIARDGFYPASIEADVSETRLGRFFSKEDDGYRVLPELRGDVVFTVQDVLADPPFSRLDLMSCRNLLIYFAPEAQTRLVTLFHFALRENGVLLLGRSESAGDVDGRFEAISKAERLYRRVGRSRPGDFGFATSEGARSPTTSGPRPARNRQAAVADLLRRLVMETYAPAAVIIDAQHEQLFSLGPISRYLRVAAGHPSQDLLAMAPSKLRGRLRSAIEQAGQGDARIVVPGGRIDRDGRSVRFSIAVQPVRSDSEPLTMVCFVEETEQETPANGGAGGRPEPAESGRRIADLERELEATRLDLQAAIRDLEIAADEQKTIHEEALSVSEEYQSTNEELLTSKEELQSLNEELTALNSQLQETLERQRTASNDLQNVLYSTDVATLFLDQDFRIRFFTPATKALFRVIPSDIGRPLSDLHSFAADGGLLTDAGAVLRTGDPIEREIKAQDGVWFTRRILPYRTHDGDVKGVVVTFVDVTERRRAADALEAAKRSAEQATMAKSRFLAAASHDLRQPLQTLTLLHGLLAKIVEGEKAKQLVARLEETLGSMTGMLNALLDINQIDAGAVEAKVARFAIGDLLDRLRTDFAVQAEAEGIDLRVVPCGLIVESDRVLLEQIVRNLLSNALKYTTRGKVLLGCRRRRDGAFSIEVWDTGIGVPETELQAIFDEYHQVDNAARQRSRGLGLGLSIVRRLSDLLGYRVRVSSRPGRGSVFAIEVTRPNGAERRDKPARPIEPEAVHDVRTGAILVVEDDPEVRALLEMLLEDDGHQVTTAPDGPAALRQLEQGGARPDLILSDYNLPNGMNGLEVGAKIRETLQSPIPAVILTGDISTETLSVIANHKFARLDKPVKPAALRRTIQLLLAARRPEPAAQQPRRTAPPAAARGDERALVFLVDDDVRLCDAMRAVLEDGGMTVEAYSTSEAFLDAYRPGRGQCLLIDAYLPGMLGLDLLQRLRDGGDRLPAIMITGSSDVQMAVQAMKAGASDFIEKPVGRDDLLASIARVLEQSQGSSSQPAWQEVAAGQIAGLTSRQREIMDLVLAGHPSKNIAADLGISQRTVENHRAAIMQKTGAASLPALARLAMAASWTGGEPAA